MQSHSYFELKNIGFLLTIRCLREYKEQEVKKKK